MNLKEIFRKVRVQISVDSNEFDYANQTQAIKNLVRLDSKKENINQNKPKWCLNRDIRSKTFFHKKKRLHQVNVFYYYNLTNFYFARRRRYKWEKWLNYQYKESLYQRYKLYRRKGLYSKVHYLYVNTSYKNTINTLIDGKGNVICRTSSGSVHRAAFKKAIRKRPFPAKVSGKEMLKLCRRLRIRKLVLVLIGPGKNRKLMLRLFKRSGLRFVMVRPVLQLPHNGCRLKKRRRL